MKAHNFRLMALRLACLNVSDRQWIYARLSASDVIRIEVLIADLNDSGLTKDISVLQQVLEVAVTNCPINSSQTELLELLEFFRKPIWRVLLLRYLDPKEREEVGRRFFADNPFVYRQLSSGIGERRLPSGWLAALKEYPGVVAKN